MFINTKLSYIIYVSHLLTIYAYKLCDLKVFQFRVKIGDLKQNYCKVDFVDDGADCWCWGQWECLLMDIWWLTFEESTSDWHLKYVLFMMPIMATMMMNMENIMMLLLHSIGKRCNDWHGEFPAIDILASVPDLQSFNHQHMRLHLHDQRLDQCPHLHD